MADQLLQDDLKDLGSEFSMRTATEEDKQKYIDAMGRKAGRCLDEGLSGILELDAALRIGGGLAALGEAKVMVHRVKEMVAAADYVKKHGEAAVAELDAIFKKTVASQKKLDKIAAEHQGNMALHKAAASKAKQCESAMAKLSHNDPFFWQAFEAAGGEKVSFEVDPVLYAK